jgi:hypothetical protein
MTARPGSTSMVTRPGSTSMTARPGTIAVVRGRCLASDHHLARRPPQSATTQWHISRKVAIQTDRRPAAAMIAKTFFLP